MLDGSLGHTSDIHCDIDLKKKIIQLCESLVCGGVMPMYVIVAVCVVFSSSVICTNNRVIFANTSKEPVCPRVELLLKIIIILLIIFLGFIKSKPC